MNVNEVLANRALEVLGEKRGSYGRMSPLDDINLHQSTNDTYPTALKLAAIAGFCWSQRSLSLARRVPSTESRFARRAQDRAHRLQDAVLTTLGREMGCYAEALARDRWRIYKCEERLRVINLGGTAIGTGRRHRGSTSSARRKPCQITGHGARPRENLVEATQNADVFVEVSGMVNTVAVNLLKICGDLGSAGGPGAVLAKLSSPAPGRLFDHAGESKPGDP